MANVLEICEQRQRIAQHSREMRIRRAAASPKDLIEQTVARVMANSADKLAEEGAGKTDGKVGELAQETTVEKQDRKIMAKLRKIADRSQLFFIADQLMDYHTWFVANNRSIGPSSQRYFSSELGYLKALLSSPTLQRGELTAQCNLLMQSLLNAFSPTGINTTRSGEKTFQKYKEEFTTIWYTVMATLLAIQKDCSPN